MTRADEAKGGAMGTEENLADVIELPVLDTDGPRAASAITKVSWSQLYSWSDCGEKFRLSYLERAPKIPQGSLIAGIAAHETVEEAYREGWWLPPADAEDPSTWPRRDEIVFDFVGRITKMTDAAGGPDAVRWGGRADNPENLDWWLKEGPRMLQRVGEVVADDHDRGLRLWNDGAGIEVEFNVPWLESRLFTARVDVILEAGSRLIIRDWTFGKPGGKNKMQGALYAEAVQEVTGRPVEAVQYVYPRGVRWDVRVQEYDPAPYLKLARSAIENYERALDAGIFVAKPSSFCKSCDVKASCDIGRTL